MFCDVEPGNSCYTVRLAGAVHCGVASVVMILNSSNLSPSLDSKHALYEYFNQEDFFTDKVKTIITPEEVKKNGISLEKLTKIIRSLGLKADLYFANEVNLDGFRNKLKNAISNQQFIIVNFFRADLHQEGGGHHSPIAAYDSKEDRFLLLDVARYKYPAYWVKTEELRQAVNTLDGNTYRGFIIITP
jgi:hypothetical protein